ncbi:hypothetical protein [Egbenema bharatensis]|uniref:hypothetical protein n=1 Tax=Egbenema bharatensis TaxID=3463334 RepID=UPI003A86D00B
MPLQNMQTTTLQYSRSANNQDVGKALEGYWKEGIPTLNHRVVAARQVQEKADAK